MQNILEDLYNDKLRPFEWRNCGLAYDELRSENLRLLQALCDELDSEKVGELNSIIDRQIEADAMEGEQRFMDGFTLGVRLMCEVFALQSR